MRKFYPPARALLVRRGKKSRSRRLWRSGRCPGPDVVEYLTNSPGPPFARLWIARGYERWQI